jgi:thioredoxin 2
MNLQKEKGLPPQKKNLKPKRESEASRTATDMAGKAVIMKVDTEKYPQLAARYNVRGIPNFAVFSEGRLAMQQAGLVDHEQMEQWLKSAAQTGRSA